MTRLALVPPMLPLLMLFLACDRTPRIVPSTAGEHRPLIHVNTAVSSDGAVDKPEVETLDSCTASGNGCAFSVFATRHTGVLVTGYARDELAAVKHLRVTASMRGQMLFDLDSTVQVDGSGKAPPQVGFVGTDGSGSFGVSSPLLIAVSDPVTLVVTATNFEGNTNSLTTVLEPLDPARASISVSPTTIRQGQVAALSVSSSPFTEMSVSPSLAIMPWPIDVSPQHTTTYTLSAKQPFSSDKVGFPNAPPATGQTVHFTTAKATATLTVIEPSVPATGPTDLAFFLQLQPVGLNTTKFVWARVLGQGSQGALTAIKNLEAFPIHLIDDSHDSEDCFSGAEVGPLLAPGQSMKADEIYGTTAFPRPILACAVFQGTPPPLLKVVVTYTT